jgi:hypothetical protein
MRFHTFGLNPLIEGVLRLWHLVQGILGPRSHISANSLSNLRPQNGHPGIDKACILPLAKAPNVS